jgi:hypothetical protein
MERWAEANWVYLQGEMERVTAAMERVMASQPARLDPPTPIPLELIERAPAIVALARTFALSTFERDVVLACAAAELLPELTKRAGMAWPVFRLALAAFPGGDPAALASGGKLRLHRLIAPSDGLPLFSAPIILDAAVLHFLMGSSALDDRLAPLLRELEPAPEARQDVIEAVVAARAHASDSLLVGLVGISEDDRQAVATAACRALGLRAFRLRAADVPADSFGRATLRERWERERQLHPFALLIELGRETAPELVRAATALLGDLGGLAFVSSHQPVWISRPSFTSFELTAPPREQRLERLKRALGPHDADLEPILERITTQFVLGGDAVERACLAAESGRGTRADRLWNACRLQARPRLDDIARRIEPRASWDDLVLPATTVAQLRELSSHIRNRTQVLEGWGFGAKAQRGLGTGALFAGASGTGKTFAAEVLAHEAQLDLYHLDLSQLVNKYIGETEKNLRRVFDAAEDSGAILLFDEADSLFGKRGEVDKGTDRYANLEVSYLLQRMEQYRGLAILTTNQRDAIDNAFVRRLRFIINFPFPDVAERLGMWQRAFPSHAPSRGIDASKLARLKLPGGNIRSIALNAAYIAAESGEPISMRHLLSASRAEFAKIERPFPEGDVTGW